MTDGAKKPEKLTRSKKPGQFVPSMSKSRRVLPAKKSVGIEDCILAALQDEVSITLNGKFGIYSFAEIIGATIVHDAVKGDKHARELIIALQAKSARSLDNDVFKVFWS